MPAEQRALTFWHASEDGEVKVIGDEPTNTDYDPGPSVEAHIARRRYVTCRVSSLDTSIERPSIVGLVVKPIGKPSAGNRHARFDERVVPCKCVELSRLRWRSRQSLASSR